MPQAESVVQVHNLRKSYGAVEALRGIAFDIRAGEVFGLLGPNGAGKTSTIEILEGLRPADSGSVRVCGMDPAREQTALKERIGAQLQNTVLSDKVRVDEALSLFAGFYRNAAPVSMLLDRFGLTEKRHAFYENLSGGQKQRLALALAMVNNPEVVLLDEPTVGLDAQLRRDIYGLIENFREERRTVLLTTHYIEEAERLCDRVAIMDGGKLLALGTPRELIARSGKGSRIEATFEHSVPLERLRPLDAILDCSESDGKYVLHTAHTAEAVSRLVKFLETNNNSLLDLHISQPSLEDVFVEMTGRSLEH